MKDKGSVFLNKNFLNDATSIRQRFRLYRAQLANRMTLTLSPGRLGLREAIEGLSEVRFQILIQYHQSVSLLNITFTYFDVLNPYADAQQGRVLLRIGHYPLLDRRLNTPQTCGVL
jgi:hypothetical protein